MHPRAGGPPVVVDRLCSELVSRGHDIQVLTTDQFADGDGAWMSSTERPYDLEVFRVKPGSRYPRSRELTQAIHRAVRNCNVVHVHTLWTHAGLSAMQVCLRSQKPYLVMPHGMLDPHSLERGWLKKQIYGRMIEWPLLRRATGMCYTHTEEERLANESCPGLPRGFIVELGAESPPPCPHSELRTNFFKIFPQLRDHLVVLFLGRLHPKKGLDLLIPAFARVVQRIRNAHLILVGPGDATYIGSIRQKVAELDLEAKVTLTGPLYGKSKWEAMAASDLFVLPSYQENFGLAVVDAIRSGLPVLLSRRVNLWDDVVTAGAGRDCELAVDSVSAQIESCLLDTDWRATTVSAGIRLLESRFNWSSSAKLLEGIYENALMSKSRRSS